MGMNKKWKKKWLQALRSGQFQQGSGLLKNGNNYCCLGILRRVMNPQDSSSCTDDRVMAKNQLLTAAHESKAGITWKIQVSLSKKNDDGHSFVQIANWIEKNL